jgi:NitT/TauT family transport system substrate-binding protein
VKKVVLLILGNLAALLVGCSSRPNGTVAHVFPEKLTIAYQSPSLTCFPPMLMEKIHILEKYAPDMAVSWEKLGTASAVNDALVSGKADIGFVGTPSFLVAFDKGATIKILAGASVYPIAVQVDKSIRELKDITPETKIAIGGGLGNTAHIALAMKCEELFGNARLFDANLVSMVSADTPLALVSGNVSAVVVGLPWITKMNVEGFPTIQYLQNLSVNCVATKELHDDYPAALGIFQSAMAEAIVLINERNAEAIKYCAEFLGLTEDEIIACLKTPGVNFTTATFAIDEVADFMYRQGYISKRPEIEDIFWEPALAAIGGQSEEK